MKTKPQERLDIPLENESELPADAPEPTRWFKLKMFAIAEALIVAIALVLPITPSKTGRPFKWPSTWGEYFDEFLFALVLGHCLFLVLFVIGWIYWKWSENRESRSEI